MYFSLVRSAVYAAAAGSVAVKAIKIDVADNGTFRGTHTE